MDTETLDTNAIADDTTSVITYAPGVWNESDTTTLIFHQ